MKNVVCCAVMCALPFCGLTEIHATDLLINGAFEPAGGEVPSWLLEEYVSTSLAPIDSAGLTVSSTTQTGIPGQRHILFRGNAGGQTPGPNNLTNAVISQVVPVSAGQEYSYSAWSRFEPNFSGGVTTLTETGPLGAVASPTTTKTMLEFLDNDSNVVGTPLTLDVKADRIAQIGFPDPNDNSYYMHELTGTAPAGATQARVSAAAHDMVWNVGPTQSMFYDTFSFSATSDPSTELLLNPGLEEVPATGLEDWTFFVNDAQVPGNTNIVRTAAFANRPASGGARGLWWSSFPGELVPPGETGNPVDGTVYQDIPGTPGLEYTFSGWTRWETNFSGGQDILSGGTQVWMGFPSPTEMYLELSFLDSAGEVIGSPTQLDLKVARQSECGGNANNQTCGPDGNGWVEHALSAVAPAGTVDVRVSALMIAGVSTGGQQSAFFDDAMLVATSVGIAGDFDGDGDVDGRDFLVWQRDTSVGNLADWQNNYGTGSLGAITSVPEPMSGALIALSLAAGCLIRGRR